VETSLLEDMQLQYGIVLQLRFAANMNEGKKDVLKLWQIHFCCCCFYYFSPCAPASSLIVSTLNLSSDVGKFPLVVF